MNLSPEEILNLPKNYNLNDIKHSFYALSRQYHPDSSNCTFLSQEDKKNIFVVLESAYKELIDRYQFVEVDAPMYCNVEYSNDVYIEKDNNLDNIEKFNEKFQVVHAEENKDNPWSIYYENNKSNKKYNLDILRPNEYNRKFYYELGVDYCNDFTQPSKFTDINHEYEDLTDIVLESTDLDSLLQDRDKIEYSEEINQYDIQKRQIISQLEHDRRQVQLERDLKILKLN